MRVLIVNSVCGVGSTGRICTDLYDELISDGHECCIAYGRGSAPDQYNTYKIGNKIDNYWHVLETRLFDNHGFASRKATKRFIEFIEKYSPDIINLHNLHGYYLNLDILFTYLSQSKAKIIMTLHDGWIFSGHSAHPELNEGGIPVFLKKDNHEYPKSYLNFAKRNYDKKKETIRKCSEIFFITPSKWLMEVASKTYLSNYSIKVINNGIDLNNFYIEKQEMENEKIQILGVASVWNDLKGLNIFEELSEILDPNKFQITLVGKNSRKKINNIRYVDRTESIDQLRKLYNSATFFVNPTFQDTFPTVNIESLACGTPVVTFNTGGSPEIINSNCGIITDKKNSHAIAKAIQRNTIFRKRDCIERAKVFDKRDKYKEYVGYFKEIISLTIGD